MKTRTLKKAWSLFLAVLMIALALPLTMLPAAAEETTESTPASITHAKVYAKRSDGYDLHTSYGSVAGMIDGDPYDTKADGRSARPYYESESISSPYTPLMVGSTMSLYYGYAVFELNGLSTLSDVTIWIAGNGYDDSQAARWSNPASSWGVNDGYEILVSTDGETWTFLKEFSGMCGDGTDPGANFPVAGDAAYASKTVDGFLRVGHKIDLRDAEGKGVSAKYVAVAVTAPSKDGCIDIGEVTVNGTVDTLDVEKTPAEIYAEAEDGELLRRVDFTDMTWMDDYRNSDNWNTYYKISEDGRTVRHLLHKSNTFGADNKRAMWGGIIKDERFSLDNGEKYTIYFDALFGSEAYNTYGIGIQVDGNNTLLIDGFGLSYWYNWNTKKVNKSDDGAYKWNYYVDDRTERNSFAVEVDSENEIMTLYVADSDGTYNKVREMTYDGADITGELICKIYMTRVNAEKNLNSSSWAEISNLNIRKGLVATKEETIDRAAEYDAANDGDLLQTVNFNKFYWEDDFHSASNVGADVELSRDGTSAKLTLLEGVSCNRAIYCGIKDGYRFPLRDVVEVIEPEEGSDEDPTYVYGDKQYKYTIVFDLDFGNNKINKYGLGVMVDGKHSVLIDGLGMNYWYEWNTKKVDGVNLGSDKWNYATNVEKSEKHTFAVEVDPENNTMTLYVADEDGTFDKVRTMTYDGAELGNTLNLRIYTRKLGGTSDENSWTEISDLKIYKGLVADIGDHVYGDWSEATEAACGVNGIQERLCSHCDDTMIDIVADALEHEYGEWTEPTEATCTEDGIKERECSVCGGKETEVVAEALGHSFGEWTETKAPTCTEAGDKERECSVCGEKETEVIDALGHDLFEENIAQDPTCTEPGYKGTSECKRCHETIVADPIPPLGHSVGEWVVTKEATCTETGIKEKKCTVCQGDAKTETIAKLAHTYGEWVQTTAPTCTEAGVKEKTCSACGDKVTETGAAALGHTHGEWVVTKEATCTETGIKEKKCTVCQGDAKTETIAKLAHTYGEWVQTKAPTYTEEGVKEKTCSICGDKVTEAIAKLTPEPTPETSAPETSAPETEPAAKSGCGASVAMSGVALVGTCAAVLAIKRRKNED